jgi:hypothetical protein
MESVLIDGMITRTDEQAFEDMRLRIINHSPCSVRFVAGIPPLYPYGALYLAPAMDDNIIAAFGDLRILVSSRKILSLIALATNENALIKVCPDLYIF